MGYTTIRISDENKILLMQLGGAIQMKKGKIVTMDTIIEELINKYKGIYVKIDKPNL